jgi:YD repeat-containing protein
LRTNILRNLGLTTNDVSVGYDNVGQLTSWHAAETGGILRQNEQLAFAYDPAHNLHSRTNPLFLHLFK